MRLFMLELAVADWQASVAWYRDRLGCTIRLRDEVHSFALLAAPIGEGLIALKQGRPASTGLLIHWEVSDLQTALTQLADRDVHPIGPIKVSPEGYHRALIRDPDGYTHCLFARLST